MELQYSPKRGFIMVPQQKKRKVSPSASAGGDFISSLFGLTDGPFSHVFAYIPKESRASFAVAITGHPSSFRRWTPPAESVEQMRAILSGRKKYLTEDWRGDWDSFDLGNVAEQYYFGGTWKDDLLNDDDLYALLVCVDAKETIRRLRFTNCFGLAGDGLEPLRGSTKLAQLDLSLLKEREDPRPYSKNGRNSGWVGLSRLRIIPILRSIIDQEVSSLKHVTLPAVWRPLIEDGGKDFDHLLEGFLLRFNDRMINRSIGCSGGAACSSKCAPMFETRQESILNEVHHYGVQPLTCYKCMAMLCDIAECPSGKKLRYCDRCQKYFCNSCAQYPPCKTCGDEYVTGWDMDVCEECMWYRDPGFSCWKCGDHYCADCIDQGEAEAEQYCIMCDEGPHCRQCMRATSYGTGRKPICSDNCFGEWERKEYTPEIEREEFPPLVVLDWQKKITEFVQR